MLFENGSGKNKNDVNTSDIRNHMVTRSRDDADGDNGMLQGGIDGFCFLNPHYFCNKFVTEIGNEKMSGKIKTMAAVCECASFRRS